MSSIKQPSEHLPPGTLCLCEDSVWLVVGENRSIILACPFSDENVPRLTTMSTTRFNWHSSWEFIEPEKVA